MWLCAVANVILNCWDNTVIDPDFDPYDQIISLTQSNFELARALNDQAKTVEQLIKHANTQESKIRNLVARVTQLEQTSTEYDRL